MSHKKDSLWDRTVPFAFGEDCLWSSCPSCMTKSTDAKEVEQQREWGWRENGDAERMEMQRAWGCREHGDAERMGRQREWGYIQREWGCRENGDAERMGTQSVLCFPGSCHG